jgi:hypothetical protein
MAISENLNGGVISVGSGSKAKMAAKMKKNQCGGSGNGGVSINERNNGGESIESNNGGGISMASAAKSSSVNIAINEK